MNMWGMASGGKGMDVAGLGRAKSKLQMTRSDGGHRWWRWWVASTMKENLTRLVIFRVNFVQRGMV